MKCVKTDLLNTVKKLNLCFLVFLFFKIKKETLKMSQIERKKSKKSLMNIYRHLLSISITNVLFNRQFMIILLQLYRNKVKSTVK